MIIISIHNARIRCHLEVLLPYLTSLHENGISVTIYHHSTLLKHLVQIMMGVISLTISQGPSTRGDIPMMLPTHTAIMVKPLTATIYTTCVCAKFRRPKNGNCHLPCFLFPLI